MPMINGEKYACDSCIKGHRVSGCTHSDRPLKHINPKGRPVKQCEHCQKARKTKSHHARCDCGTKKDKTKAAAEKAASEGEQDARSGLETALNLQNGQEERGCRCYLGQGAQCVCGLKKEPLDLRIDTGIHRLPTMSKNKPPLVSSRSEAHLTVFANGHHKPCHGRLNNTAHTSGAPYKIPRHHTSHVPLQKSHDNLGEIYSKSMDPARRSVDSLSLTNNSFGYFTPQTTAESVPLTPLAGSFEHDSSTFDPSKFMFGSQHSVLDKLVGGTSMPHGLPLSESMPVHTYQWMDNMYPSQSVPQYGLDSISTSPTGDLTPELDFGIPTGNTDFNVNPWSAGDLPLDPNKLSDSLAQPISHSGESNRQSMPGMTTSSSGAQSEVGEPSLFGDMDMKMSHQQQQQQQPQSTNDQLLNDAFPFREPSAYRLSTQSLQSQSQIPTSYPANEPRRSLDLDLIRGSQESLPMDFSQSQSPESMNIFASTAPLDNQSMFQTTTAAPSDFSASFIPTTADFTMAPTQSGLDASVGPNADADQSQNWYNLLGNGIGMNSLSMPLTSMSNPNPAHEYPGWL